MNQNCPKRCQTESAENNLDKIDVKKTKFEEEHQNSSSCTNNKYDIQLCKMNAAEMFQNETFPNLNGYAELGKS